MKYVSTLQGQDDGYLNTAPLKDQFKTFHESRVDVALLITFGVGPRMVRY